MKHVVACPKIPARELERVLTRPEQRVAGMIAKGHTNKEIAEELGLSPNTARNYVKRVVRQLGVSRRSQVAPSSRDSTNQNDGSRGYTVMRQIERRGRRNLALNLVILSCSHRDFSDGLTIRRISTYFS